MDQSLVLWPVRTSIWLEKSAVVDESEMVKATVKTTAAAVNNTVINVYDVVMANLVQQCTSGGGFLIDCCLCIELDLGTVRGGVPSA